MRYSQIFITAFLAMEAINKDHKPSHDKEDWVIENFMDRVIALGYKGNPTTVATWWFKKNQSKTIDLTNLKS